MIDNTAFIPGPGAASAHTDFAGTLRLAETPMTTLPAKFKSAIVFGRSTRLFPAVALSFFTDRGDLVPVTQDVIRAGSLSAGRSFWDIIVQPGRVWSVPEDDGWSRAAFPFALVNSLEGETHNGLASFRYRSGEVSALRFQIVQQTAPFYVTDYFDAAGFVPATYQAPDWPDQAALAASYEASLADAIPIAPWADLAHKVGADKLSGFDGAMPLADIVLSGLDDGKTFYLEQCHSAGGPLPWCDRARFGVWSATKALIDSMALLHLAELYGSAVFDLRIRDYVHEVADVPAWHDVRFGDAIDMATGIGSGSTKRDPNDIDDGYIDAQYGAWYEARSSAQKLAAIARNSPAYPRGPGQVVRYRDQDMFILGVAMDRLLKQKQGPRADLWSTLQRDVLLPIGIHYAPINRTIESDGAPGQPLMAFGYYPTIGDIVKIARLYQNHGAHDGAQLLYAPRVAALLYGTVPRGLPTGAYDKFGETTYFNAFWHERYDAADGCRLYIPRMLGWGGNMVALMPGGYTGVRISKNSDPNDAAVFDTAGMSAVANRLVGFCGR